MTSARRARRGRATRPSTARKNARKARARHCATGRVVRAGASVRVVPARVRWARSSAPPASTPRPIKRTADPAGSSARNTRPAARGRARTRLGRRSVALAPVRSAPRTAASRSATMSAVAGNATTRLAPLAPAPRRRSDPSKVKRRQGRNAGDVCEASSHTDEGEGCPEPSPGSPFRRQAARCVRSSVCVTSNTQAGLMLTTLPPSSPPITGATIVMPFWPLRTTRPAFSQA